MSLQALLDKTKTTFTKKYKDTNVKFQLANKELPPTGLIIDNPGLEHALDRRFIAYGRCYLLYGKKGNSKTSLLFDLFKLFINNGGDAIWIETEHAGDLDYARKQGIDVDGEHFTIQQPATLEEGLTLAKDYIKNYTGLYPDGDGPPLIIGFDSIAGTMTEYEEENNKIGENKVGNHAKLMADFYRKIVEPLACENIIFVACNQLKDRIGGMSFGVEPGEAMLGGEAPRFSSTYQWKVVRTKDLTAKDDYGVDRKIGSRHELIVRRNKLGREGNSQWVEFDLYINGGIDWYSPQVRNAAEVYTDLVEKATGGYYYWKIPNITYYAVENDEKGNVVSVPKIVDTEKKYREQEMALIFRDSPEIKQILRTRDGIPPLPTEDVVQEVKKENKKKRANNRKRIDDEEPAVKAV
jgi:recombination protein RecA